MGSVCDQGTDQETLRFFLFIIFNIWNPCTLVRRFLFINVDIPRSSPVFEYFHQFFWLLILYMYEGLELILCMYIRTGASDLINVEHQTSLIQN